MAEINVTPMVDVMLVLLIIFMVSAPLLTVGVPLDLAQTDRELFLQLLGLLVHDDDERGDARGQEYAALLSGNVAEYDNRQQDRDHLASPGLVNGTAGFRKSGPCPARPRPPHQWWSRQRSRGIIPWG